jgi:hypothetical protein
MTPASRPGLTTIDRATTDYLTAAGLAVAA